jgi:hypothetical protein
MLPNTEKYRIREEGLGKNRKGDTILHNPDFVESLRIGYNLSKTGKMSGFNKLPTITGKYL